MIEAVVVEYGLDPGRRGRRHGIGDAGVLPGGFYRWRDHRRPALRERKDRLRPHARLWHAIGSAIAEIPTRCLAAPRSLTYDIGLARLRRSSSSNADAIVEQWRAIHGLDARSTRSEMVDGHSRYVWCNAQGQELIEEYRIAGMGHGTPLDTAGDAALGVGGPFMLDVGISSTRHIARFWGIAKPCVMRDAKTKPARANSEALAPGCARAFSMPKAGVPNVPQSAKRADIPPSQKPNSAAEIRKVIEDALRSAGLMH